jgi:hypothetical protein
VGGVWVYPDFATICRANRYSVLFFKKIEHGKSLRALARMFKGL